MDRTQILYQTAVDIHIRPSINMDRRVNKSSPGSYKRAQAESALKIDQFAKSRKYTPIKKKLIGAQEKKVQNYFQQVQQQEKSKERKQKRHVKNDEDIGEADEASISQSESNAQQNEPGIKIWRKEDLHYDEVEQKEAELKRLKRQKYKENKKKRARGSDEASASQDEDNQRDKKRRRVDSVIQGVQDFSSGDNKVNIIGPDSFQGGSGSRDVDDDSFSDREANNNNSSNNKHNLNNTPSPKKLAENNNNNNQNKKKEKKISIRGVDRSNPYYKAMVEFERKRLEQEDKEKQIRIAKHEKQIASKNRNKKKHQSFQQTQRGQPLMKNKINALLDKIGHK